MDLGSWQWSSDLSVDIVLFMFLEWVCSIKDISSLDASVRPVSKFTLVVFVVAPYIDYD